MSAMIHMYDVNMTLIIACGCSVSRSGSSDIPVIIQKKRILKREMVDMLTVLCHTLTYFPAHSLTNLVNQSIT